MEFNCHELVPRTNCLNYSKGLLTTDRTDDFNGWGASIPGPEIPLLQQLFAIEADCEARLMYIGLDSAD